MLHTIETSPFVITLSEKKNKKSQKNNVKVTLDFTVSIPMARLPAKEVQVERSQSSSMKLNEIISGHAERLITVIG